MWKCFQIICEGARKGLPPDPSGPKLCHQHITRIPSIYPGLSWNRQGASLVSHNEILCQGLFLEVGLRYNLYFKKSVPLQAISPTQHALLKIISCLPQRLTYITSHIKAFPNVWVDGDSFSTNYWLQVSQLFLYSQTTILYCSKDLCSSYLSNQMLSRSWQLQWRMYRKNIYFLPHYLLIAEWLLLA